MPLVSEMLCKNYPPTEYLIDPYVVRGGVTFLYGKTGVGKSPYTWEMARCVSAGIPFLSRATRQGHVLYIDRETEEALMIPRIMHMPRPFGDGWFLECMVRRPAQDAFTFGDHWDVVIWNSLRKFLPQTSINNGEVVSPFYDTLKSKFPHAGHVVIAHERKSFLDDSQAPDREAFSGNMAWLDQAQVGIQIVQTPGYYAVRHVKSQVSRLIEETRFILEPDGGTCRPWERTREVVEMLLQAPGATMRDKVMWVAARTGKGADTVWRAWQEHQRKQGKPPDETVVCE